MKITGAHKEDAPMIAHAIVEAIGREHCQSLVGDDHSVDEIEEIFKKLAQRDDTQYSYRNTLTAVNDDGETIGVCIAYDGTNLYKMRQPFLDEVQKSFDFDVDNVDYETEAGEFYIDTVAVLPDYRGQNIGGQLILAAIDKARNLGLKPGLLVAKDNHRARNLYERLGFVKVGDRLFMGIVMDHMQA